MHKKNRSAFFIISALYGASLFAIAFMFSLFSCSHEPIFWAIDREIKLREADIKGNVYSIILHRNHLYAANGQIYAKSLNSEGGWTLFPFPQPDGYISTLASDSDGTNAYLYALAMQRDEQQVWVLGTSGWQKIEGASSDSLLGSKAIALFDNGGNAAGTNAYIRVNGKVYKLNGINPVSSLGANITNNGASDKTVACAHLGGNDWFSDTVSICSTNGIPAAKLYKAFPSALPKEATEKISLVPKAASALLSSVPALCGIPALFKGIASKPFFVPAIKRLFALS